MNGEGEKRINGKQLFVCLCEPAQRAKQSRLRTHKVAIIGEKQLNKKGDVQ
jgi:hypothetical protein